MVRNFLLLLWTSVVLIMMGHVSALAGEASELALVHADIVKRFPSVKHFTTTQLAALSPENVLMVDVRKAKEYRVSHLANSIRVSPRMSADKFVAVHQKASSGKVILFYCSVGVRSSKLAKAVQARLPKAEIYNLEGGIFKWHNESRPLVNSAGPTDFIHPYNKYWGRLLTRQDQIFSK